MDLILQISAALLCVALSGFFSGVETGIYRLSRFRLRLGLGQGKRAFRILGGVIEDSHGTVLTSLVGNNLANYGATSLITYILLTNSATRNSAELYAAAIMTPALFVFGDIIPKSLFYLHSDRILPRLSVVLWLFHKLFTYTGIVGALKYISELLSRLLGLGTDAADVITAGRKTQFKQIINETLDEGVVSAFQKDVMERTVEIPTMPVKTVMIPFSKVVMADTKSSRDELREKLRESSYTRLPVYSNARSNVIGLINIYQVLGCGEEFNDLERFIEPIGMLLATTSVLEAITQMRKHSYKIMLVTPDYEHKRKSNVLGIVTMKDLVEELTGELSPW